MSTVLTYHSNVKGSVYSNVYNPATAPKERPISSGPRPPPGGVGVGCGRPKTANMQTAHQPSPTVVINPPVIPRLNLVEMPSASIVHHVTSARNATQTASTKIIEPSNGPLTDRVKTILDRASDDYRRHMQLIRYLRGDQVSTSKSCARPPQHPSGPSTARNHQKQRIFAPTSSSSTVTGGDDVQNILSRASPKASGRTLVMGKGYDSVGDARRQFQEKETVYMQDFTGRNKLFINSNTTEHRQHPLYRPREVPFHEQPSRQWLVPDPTPRPTPVEPSPMNAWRNVYTPDTVLKHSTHVLSGRAAVRHQKEMSNALQMPAAGVSTSNW